MKQMEFAREGAVCTRGAAVHMYMPATVHMYMPATVHMYTPTRGASCSKEEGNEAGAQSRSWKVGSASGIVKQALHR